MEFSRQTTTLKSGEIGKSREAIQGLLTGSLRRWIYRWVVTLKW